MNANPNDAPIAHIAICGSGLAAEMAAAALSQQLPPNIRITVAGVDGTVDSDLFYGNAASPTAYAFNLAAGLSEPKLLLESDTAFSWGTKYVRWAASGRSWIQCFHLALPIIDGVLFHHYLAKIGESQLDHYLVSATAARKGVFMHPPQPQAAAGQQALARAEYGYQLDPASYAPLFRGSMNAHRVRRIQGVATEIQCGANGISAIRLSNGETLTADLYVDCSGPDATLLAATCSTWLGSRRLRAVMARKQTAELGPPVREVTPANYGWRSDSHLQGSVARLAVYDPESEAEALGSLGASPERRAEATIGRRAEAWSGNCVAIGHAASVVEPLTPAPIMLLEREIERLVSLIPFSTDMTVERREFNRRFAEDHEHAELFTRALFENPDLPDTPYWRAARAEPVGEKLARKIELFEDRGFPVSYDLEPFNEEDWTILHYGMGRRAARYDRTADRAPPDRIREFLANFRREVDKTVDGMPSHATYMAELKRYLARSGQR
jgi:tryptophan halogenase